MTLHALSLPCGFQVQLVVMKGAGGKAFCAGGDVVTVRRSILESPNPAPGIQGNDYADFFREEYQLDYDIFTARKPQVRAYQIWFALYEAVGSES